MRKMLMNGSVMAAAGVALILANNAYNTNIQTQVNTNQYTQNAELNQTQELENTSEIISSVQGNEYTLMLMTDSQPEEALQSDFSLGIQESTAVAAATETTVTEAATEASTAATEAAQEEIDPAEQALIEEIESKAPNGLEELDQVVVANVGQSLNIREDASQDANVLGKMMNGAVATVIEQGEEWTKIESGSVTGYVSNDYLLFGNEAKLYVVDNYDYVATVDTSVLNVREEQSTESNRIKAVKQGAELSVTEVNDEWITVNLKDDVTGYVSSEYVTLGWNYETAVSNEEIVAAARAAEAARNAAASASANTSTGAQSATTAATATTATTTTTVTPPAGSTGADVVNYALQFVGNPYVSGGTSLTNGADCSGFTMSVYAAFGYSLSRSSSGQASNGVEVALSDVQPGDLIIYSGHVGIYIGNGQIVHASKPSTGIRVSSMYCLTPTGARRIIQ